MIFINKISNFFWKTFSRDEFNTVQNYSKDYLDGLRGKLSCTKLSINFTPLEAGGSVTVIDLTKSKNRTNIVPPASSPETVLKDNGVALADTDIAVFDSLKCRDKAVWVFKGQKIILMNAQKDDAQLTKNEGIRDAVKLDTASPQRKSANIQVYR